MTFYLFAHPLKLSKYLAASESFYDVIILGAGPAGSTAANYLLRAGHKVLLCEKKKFPRPAIGESMWIATNSLMKDMGVLDRVSNAGFGPKNGGSLIWGPLNESWPIYFVKPDNSIVGAFNVERSKFDQILAERAVELGCHLKMETKCYQINQAKGKCHVLVNEKGVSKSFYSKFVIDATGLRSTFNPAANLLHMRPSSISIWAYFKNAKMLPFPEHKNGITVRFENGWFWLFPVGRNLYSIGLCADTDTILQYKGTEKLKTCFYENVEHCDEIKQLMEDAIVISDFKALSFKPKNLSKYYYKNMLSVGDSACFIDPVLSTGINLSMNGGCYAARALNTIFEGGNQNDVFKSFDSFLRNDFNIALTMTDDLVAMNSHLNGAYWKSRMFHNPNQNKKVKLRLNQVAQLIKLKGDREAQAIKQNLQAIETDTQFGASKFLTDDFKFKSVRLNPLTKIRKGYHKGFLGQLTFSQGYLVFLKKSNVYPAFHIDLMLFEHASNWINISSLADCTRIIAASDRISEDELYYRIAEWLKRKVFIISENEEK